MRETTSVFWYAVVACVALVTWSSVGPDNLKEATKV